MSSVFNTPRSPRKTPMGKQNNIDFALKSTKTRKSVVSPVASVEKASAEIKVENHED